MFDVGFTELTLLAVLGLLVLGPERLPAVAKVIGGYVRKARRTWNTVRAEIESEMAAEELRKTIRQPLDELDELRKMANEQINVDGPPTKPKPNEQAERNTASSRAAEEASDAPPAGDDDDKAESETPESTPKSTDASSS